MWPIGSRDGREHSTVGYLRQVTTMSGPEDSELQTEYEGGMCVSGEAELPQSRLQTIFF